VSSVVPELQSLGDTTSELDGVQKILRVVPKRYAQMACSIETLLDLKELSINELSGRLAASEERGAPEQDTDGRLLLTEEKWHARQGNRHVGDSSSGGGGKGKKPQGRPQSKDGGARNNGGGKPPRRNGKCNYCGIEGHWARECRKAKRDRGDQGRREEANLVQASADENDGDPAMFMIEEVSLSAMGASEHVFLNEERARAVLRRSPDDVDPAWYLDTGASNHMTGDEAAFAELDKGVGGTVKFGDGSLVAIHGRGTVLFTVSGEEHRLLTQVYWIPRLKTNIVSIGQLEEIGCPTLVKDGYMTVRDHQERILARVPRARNRASPARQASVPGRARRRGRMALACQVRSSTLRRPCQIGASRHGAPAAIDRTQRAGL
jgi:hypothetical protein